MVHWQRHADPPHPNMPPPDGAGFSLGIVLLQIRRAYGAEVQLWKISSR